jgi:hypothetical protein
MGLGWREVAVVIAERVPFHRCPHVGPPPAPPRRRRARRQDLPIARADRQLCATGRGATCAPRTRRSRSSSERSWSWQVPGRTSGSAQSSQAVWASCRTGGQRGRRRYMLRDKRRTRPRGPLSCPGAQGCLGPVAIAASPAHDARLRGRRAMLLCVVKVLRRCWQTSDGPLG